MTRDRRGPIAAFGDDELSDVVYAEYQPDDSSLPAVDDPDAAVITQVMDEGHAVPQAAPADASTDKTRPIFTPRVYRMAIMGDGDIVEQVTRYLKRRYAPENRRDDINIIYDTRGFNVRNYWQGEEGQKSPMTKAVVAYNPELLVVTYDTEMIWNESARFLEDRIARKIHTAIIGEKRKPFDFAFVVEGAKFVNFDEYRRNCLKREKPWAAMGQFTAEEEGLQELSNEMDTIVRTRYPSFVRRPK